MRLSVDGEQALADLSFTASPGTVTAVIGLSEASTSALVDVLAGTMQPSMGEVDFDGHDVAADDVRPHVGVVPRHDLLHPQLTVEQGLLYAAELRLPPGTSKDQRREAVRSVLEKLDMTELRTAKAGQPDRRAAKARIAGHRTADRSIADRLRRTDRRPRSRSGATDHGDAAATRRRGTRRSGGDDGAHRARRVRPGGAAHPDRHSDLRRSTVADRSSAGHDRLGRDHPACPHRSLRRARRVPGPPAGAATTGAAAGAVRGAARAHGASKHRCARSPLRPVARPG